MTHKYSLDEIDRMRAVLLRRHWPDIDLSLLRGGNSFVGDGTGRSTVEWYRDAQLAAPELAERELQTLMIGGVRPDELEAKYPAPPTDNTCVYTGLEPNYFLSGTEPAIIKGGIVGESDRRS